MPSSPSLGGRGRRQLLLHCALCSIFCSFSQILLALFLVGLFQLLFCPSPSLVSIPPWPPLSLSPLLRCPSSLTFTFPSSSSMGRERGRRRRRLRWRGGGAARAGGRAGRTHFQLDRFVRPSVRRFDRRPLFPRRRRRSRATLSVACVVRARRESCCSLLGPARSSLARGRAGVQRRTRAAPSGLPSFSSPSPPPRQPLTFPSPFSSPSLA